MRCGFESRPHHTQAGPVRGVRLPKPATEAATPQSSPGRAGQLQPVGAYDPQASARRRAVFAGRAHLPIAVRGTNQTQPGRTGATVARALKVCSTKRCPELVPAGRCAACTAAAEQQRGSAARRGYGRRHRDRFRAGVLARDPLCVCVDEHRGPGGHGRAGCLVPSVHADHHPRDRDELVRLHLDPDDPAHGRGLCQPCHSWHTSQAQPGGWNAR